MPKTTLTAATARIVYYDVEALPNVFTVSAYDPMAGQVHVFHLVDGALGDQLATQGSMEAARRAIRVANPALPVSARIVFHDLRTHRGNRNLALMMGMYTGERLHVVDPVTTLPPVDAPTWQPLNQLYRPTCDTDDEYDCRNHPLLAGYNSRRYDTTIIARLLDDTWALTRRDIAEQAKRVAVRQTRPRFQPTTAALMFDHNTAMFSEAYKQKMASYLPWGSVAAAIRSSMINSGRHIDVSGFNEGTMIGLKRVLAGMGRQILEFGDFTKPIKTIDELLQLVAYNVSDVVGLAAVFEHPVYAGTFDLKAGLLTTYPECIYEFGKPHTRRNVRSWRLTLDSTAAQFAARILAPGRRLPDLPGISYWYPEETIAEQTGVQRRNVLDDTLSWFRSEIDMSNPKGRAAFAQVSEALSYYQDLEGLNVNDSENHVGATDFTAVADVARKPNNVPYFRRCGTPTTGYVNFSIGGIHGAELNLEAWLADAQLVQQRNDDRMAVQALYPDPLDLWQATPGNRSVCVNGREWARSKLLTASTRKKDLVERKQQLEALGTDPAPEQLDEWVQRWEQVGYRQLEPDLPMFVDLPGGANRLHPKYAATSCGPAIHEDFTSYYPNLLRNLAAFRNPDLGEDRYAAIFEQKEDLGRQLKAPGLSPEARARLGVLREGTKLILNSASGAADASRDTAVRMNNCIVSMRIIGQLLTWRVGQAQTFAGATIISTNTDGLYSVGLDAETNNQVLAEQAAAINIGIEPEPIGVVSKDSNNRVEFKLHGVDELSTAPIVAASGGSLAAFAGPTPKKSLAHPAVLDWALARYLRETLAGNVDLDRPLDRKLGRELIVEAASGNPFEACRLFQHILVSSPSKRIIPFGIDLCSVANDELAKGEAVMLPHTSRLFFVRRDPASQVQQLVLLAATSSPVRAEDPWLHQKARTVLRANGWSNGGEPDATPLPEGHNPATRKVTGVSPEWTVIVANHDLLQPPAGALTPAQLVEMLDLDRYLEMLAATFEANWMNRPAGQSEPLEGAPGDDEHGDDPLVPEVAA